MRTLLEIIEAVKANEPATGEEMRYALCAMSALSHFDTSALRRLFVAEAEGKKPFLVTSAVYQAEESHRRWQAALAKPPKEYVGWNNDPANPAYQRRRRVSAKLFEKIAAANNRTP